MFFTIINLIVIPLIQFQVVNFMIGYNKPETTAESRLQSHLTKILVNFLHSKQEIVTLPRLVLTLEFIPGRR